MIAARSSIPTSSHRGCRCNRRYKRCRIHRFVPRALPGYYPRSFLSFVEDGVKHCGISIREIISRGQSVGADSIRCEIGARTSRLVIGISIEVRIPQNQFRRCRENGIARRLFFTSVTTHRRNTSEDISAKCLSDNHSSTIIILKINRDKGLLQSKINFHTRQKDTRPRNARR